MKCKTYAQLNAIHEGPTYLQKIYLILLLIFCIQNIASTNIKNAYWYNLPKDTIEINNELILFNSFLELEIDVNFIKDIIVEGYDKNNNNVYHKKILSDILQTAKNESYNNRYYNLFIETEYLPAPPTKIIIKDNKGNILNKFDCEYCLFSGKVKSDFQYSNLIIGIIPNNFKDPNLGIKCKTKDFFSILLPKRKFKNIYATTNTYGKTTLETWIYDFNANKNKEQINLEISNGEIYNLHIWKNSEGEKTLYLTFRPMIMRQSKIKELYIEGEKFNQVDFGFNLNKDDIVVKENNKKLTIRSVQPFYETTKDGFAIKSYIIQVEYQNSPIGNLNIEFSTRINSVRYRGISLITIDN